MCTYIVYVLSPREFWANLLHRLSNNISTWLMAPLQAMYILLTFFIIELSENVRIDLETA